MNDVKYVQLENNKVLIFPSINSHVEVVNTYNNILSSRFNVVSAGFVNISKDGLFAYGNSVTLECNSNPSIFDTLDINSFKLVIDISSIDSGYIEFRCITNDEEFLNKLYYAPAEFVVILPVGYTTDNSIFKEYVNLNKRLHTTIDDSHPQFKNKTMIDASILKFFGLIDFTDYNDILNKLNLE